MSEWRTNRRTRKAFPKRNPAMMTESERVRLATGKRPKPMGQVEGFVSGEGIRVVGQTPQTFTTEDGKVTWTSKGGRAGEFSFDIDKFLKIFSAERYHPERVLDDYYPDLTGVREELEKEQYGTEEEIEKRLEEIEQEELDSQRREYINNLESSFDRLLTSGPIKGISDVSFDWPNGKVRVSVDDVDALFTSEREAMNGFGLFSAESDEQLFEEASGKSIPEVAASHFGWLSYVPEIYGTASLDRLMDRR